MAGAFDTLKTVLSAMLGVRRKADHESAQLNPVHVIVAGLVIAGIFILTLITIVRFVVD